MEPAPLIHIGTSGWNHPHWHRPFYPPKQDLQQSLLAYYAERFQTVEINTSFFLATESAHCKECAHSVHSG